MYEVKVVHEDGGHRVADGLFEGQELDEARGKADKMAAKHKGKRYVIVDGWGNQIYSAFEEKPDPVLYSVKISTERDLLPVPGNAEYTSIVDAERQARSLAINNFNTRYVVKSNHTFKTHFLVELVIRRP